MDDLIGLSKPFTRLIDKLSDATKGGLAPYQIKRIAKAEGEAVKIDATAKGEAVLIQQRAQHRVEIEQMQHQRNLENIIQRSEQYLRTDANPKDINNDWMNKLLAEARIVSDDEMQEIWSRILAGEANNPGSFSKRTLTFVANIEKSEAELFTTLCSFGWWIEGLFTPLIFNVEDSIYQEQALSFDSLLHLESVGLIQFNQAKGYARKDLPQGTKVTYFEANALLYFPPDKTTIDLPIGQVLLTPIGHELAQLCNPRPIEEFFLYVQNQWRVRAHCILR